MTQRANGNEVQKIARERILILFEEAEAVFPLDASLSDRYIEIARRIAMRHRIRIPRELRRRFCRSCGSYLVPGVGARIRIHRGRVVVTCLRCRQQRRYPVARRGDRQ